MFIWKPMFVWIWFYIVKCSPNANVCVDTIVYMETNVQDIPV